MSDPFALGSENLKELAALNLEAKEVERIAEQIGQDIQAREESDCETVFSEMRGPDAVKDIPETAYVEMDGTGVPVVAKETEGRRGKGEDEEANTREAKLGCVFTQSRLDEKGKPVRDEASTTYVGTIQTAEEFGKRIYAELYLRGLARAKRIVVLGDGALWIWGLAEEHFPGAIEILDSFHALEHLWNVARIAFGKQDASLKAWIQPRLRELDKGDIPALLLAFQALPVTDTKSVETIKTEMEFFEKNQARMQYAHFRSLGLFVGSGVIEACCKSVVAQRLKFSGMHWTVRGANAIISLRRCFLSGKWEDYWRSRASAYKLYLLLCRTPIQCFPELVRSREGFPSFGKASR